MEEFHMADIKRIDFCIECRKDTEYILKKIMQKRTVKDKEYEYETLAAYCSKCGNEMNVPGLLDYALKAFDEQYRRQEDIISIDDIKKLMDLYHLGKAPLSLALGFGEITVTRYLEGQMPTKAYSDIMKEALSSPGYMEELLIANAEKLGNSTYKKSMKAVSNLKDLFNISDEMRMAIAHVFNEVQEITPLALQKMLYFIQGIHLALFNEELFKEDCRAWIHGPAYREIYNIFKDFKYNPIEDNRFSLFTVRNKELSPDGKKVIGLVSDCFGIYSGKVLESVTHKEKPWRDARIGLNETEPSNRIIPKAIMKAYFKDMAMHYDIDTEEGLSQYIRDKAGFTEVR